MRSYIVFLDAPSARQLREHPDAKYTWQVASTSTPRKRTRDEETASEADDSDRRKLQRNETGERSLDAADASNASEYVNTGAQSPEKSEGKKYAKEITFADTADVLDDDVQPMSTQDANSGDLDDSWILSPEMISAASERLSQMYKGVIFKDGDDEEEEEDLVEGDDESESRQLDESRSSGAEGDGSVISWPSTNPAQNVYLAPDSPQVEISFLRDHSASQHKHTARNLSRAHDHTTFLATQDTNSYMFSYMQSCMINSTSSIALFPTFRINLHSLASLSALIRTPLEPSAKLASEKWSKKVNLLAAILELEGPEVIKIKNGPDAGKEVSVLKMVVGEPGVGSGDDSVAEASVLEKDEPSASGPFCRLTAWRETAEAWAGEGGADGREGVAVKRGDVVYIENVLLSYAPQPISAAVHPRRYPTPAHSLTASPRLDSHILVCFRTLPSTRPDKALRPDLRLGASDPGVRRVEAIVRWMESMVGV